MSGGSRVSIPNNVRKTIQDIREITGNHSDEDIYAMLKECNMDPNETVQKLLYIDTFHEVKRKHDRRKVNVKNRASEEYRSSMGMQWRGARGGRLNFFVSDDAVNGRNLSSQKENGVIIHRQGGSRHSMPVLQKTENTETSHVTKPTIAINGLSTVSNGSYGNGPVHRFSEVSFDRHLKDTTIDVSKLGTVPTVDNVAMRQHPTSNTCPNPNPSSLSTIVRVEGPTSTSSSSDFSISVTSTSASGVYSSVSDPVLMLPLNSQTSGAVGALGHEIGDLHNISGSNGTLLAENRSNTGQDVAIHSQVAPGNVNFTNWTRPRKSLGVEWNQLSELSQSPSLPTHASSLVSISNRESGPSQQLVTESEPVILPTVIAQCLPELNVSVLEVADSKLDMDMKTLKLSGHETVIFPDHLHVPDAFRQGLTFGSLDATSVVKGSIPVSESIQGNNKIAREPSSSYQNVTSAEEYDYPDHPHTSHVPESTSSLEDNASFSTILTNEQSKQEILPILGVQTASDNSFGFAAPVIGAHLVQFEGPEIQSSNSFASSASSSTLPVTQPPLAAQTSIAVPPQFHFFQQPYPPNLYQYGPYFPHIYLPHNTYQFVGHTAFPQQPSTGNIYIPPGSASAGDKLPVPPSFKSGTNDGNLSHLGIPQCYSSYSSSSIGDSTTPVTTASSDTNEDIATSKAKETYSTVHQGEDSHVWPTGFGRDMPGLQASYIYNLTQGQHVAFSPAQAGHAFARIYHPAQAK